MSKNTNVKLLALDQNKLNDDFVHTSSYTAANASNASRHSLLSSKSLSVPLPNFKCASSRLASCSHYGRFESSKRITIFATSAILKLMTNNITTYDMNNVSVLK
eukprot:4193569-Amphidinium_carterae.1